MRILLHGGTVVDPDGERTADVLVVDGRITRVEPNILIDADENIDHTIDCTSRFILPGLIDAHSHADGLLSDEAVQTSLLKQGVTTVIAGQDGVSYAPGDGAYGSEYFAAINGPHPTYSGGGVAEYLASVTGASRLNAAYTIPAGTVRWEVCGRSTTPASQQDVARMQELVAQGMSEGAVGLSTGLDYVPGIFATSEEIAALCEPVARAGGVYVSHMRGGYEANSSEGIDEITRIAEATGIKVHVSHFHAEAHIVLGQLDALGAAGIDATFDAYPYTRGCTLVGMPLLPPELSARPVDEVVAVLENPNERKRLREAWFPEVDRKPSLGPNWPDMITLGHIGSDELAWAHGLTIAQAAEQAGTDAIEFALDLLAASRLQANAVMSVRYARPVSELARIFSHPLHMGGSDGIFVGAHPHPRARGTFARYLREYVRETRTWTWPEAAAHLSTAPAERFSLGRRGRIREGWVADLVVVSPNTVADMATYDDPLADAVGIDDVLVAGVPVLIDGKITSSLPGQGLGPSSVDHED